MVFYIAVQCALIILLNIVLYYVWLVTTKYRVFLFSLKQNGRWMPLLPFVGNAYIIFFGGLKVNVLYGFEWAKRYVGMPFNLWYGNKYHYVSNSADDAKIVLNHPKLLDKAEVYSNFNDILGNSLLMIPGQEWKNRRRFLKTAYNTNMINKYMPILYQQSRVLIDLIKKKKPEDDHFQFFNAHTFISFFLTSIGSVAEGITENDIKEFTHCVDQMQDEFVKILANPVLPIFIYGPLTMWEKFKFMKIRLMNVLDHILMKKKAQMAKQPEYVENVTELPFMELLLNDGYKTKENDLSIYQDLLLFAAAATDTTGSTLTFLFTLLGMFPDIQQKVYEEATRVTEDREIDNLMLSKLIYIEAVINEVMRLFPTAPLIGRYCSEDVQLQDKILPAGSNIILSIFEIQRNPEYWDNPLDFDPTRFLPENVAKIKPGSFVPFSLGSRNCIGYRLAIATLKTTVAVVVKNFKIISKHENINEFNLTSRFTMRTSNRLDLHFIPRLQNGH